MTNQVFIKRTQTPYGDIYHQASPAAALDPACDYTVIPQDIWNLYIDTLNIVAQIEARFDQAILGISGQDDNVA